MGTSTGVRPPSMRVPHIEPPRIKPSLAELRAESEAFNAAWRQILQALHLAWYEHSSGLERALAVAQASATVMLPLVVFSGEAWCGYCEKLRDEVLATSQFALWVHSKCLLPVKIDLPADPASRDEADKALVARYNITGFPTALCLNPDGSERGRIVGYAPGSGPAAWIDAMGNNAQLNACVWGLPCPCEPVL